MRIVFSEDYNRSHIDLPRDPGSNPYFYKRENLTIVNWADSIDIEEKLKGDQKAFIEAIGKNNPKRVLFSSNWIRWILEAPENFSQQLEIAAEVTYFNGTGYVKVALPILINLIADIGNTFEDSKAISAGSYRGYLSAFNRTDDPVDCYRIQLLKGQTVRVGAAFRQMGYVNLTLYDPTGNSRAYTSSGEFYDDAPHFLQELVYEVDADGYWFIKISAASDNGIYLLNVETE